jgi:hypothetical protein
MSLEGILAGLVLTLLVGSWVALPLLRQSGSKMGDAGGNVLETTPVERQRERLTIYYGRVLRNLHDLDEDFSTGKLNDSDYHSEREGWVQRGVLVLKALDELNVANLVADAKADDASIDAAIDDRIELAVSAYRNR